MCGPSILTFLLRLFIRKEVFITSMGQEENDIAMFDVASRSREDHELGAEKLTQEPNQHKLSVKEELVEVHLDIDVFVANGMGRI